MPSTPNPNYAPRRRHPDHPDPMTTETKADQAILALIYRQWLANECYFDGRNWRYAHRPAKGIYSPTGKRSITAWNPIAKKHFTGSDSLHLAAQAYRLNTTYQHA